MINQLIFFAHRSIYFAQTAGVDCNNGGASCDTGLPKIGAGNSNGFNDAQIVLQIVFGVLGAVALIYIIIAALKYVTSQGDPQSTTRAKDTILYAVIGLITGLLFIAAPGYKVFAIDVLNPGDGGGPCNNSNASSTPVVCGDNSSSANANNPLFGPDGILTQIVNVLSIIVGIAAVIVIVIQGLRMILSNGSSETVAKARAGIFFAVGGLIVAVLAQALVAFVLSKVQ
jgi:hypothetical protein